MLKRVSFADTRKHNKEDSHHGSTTTRLSSSWSTCVNSENLKRARKSNSCQFLRSTIILDKRHLWNSLLCSLSPPSVALCVLARSILFLLKKQSRGREEGNRQNAVKQVRQGWCKRIRPRDLKALSAGVLSRETERDKEKNRGTPSKRQTVHWRRGWQLNIHPLVNETTWQLQRILKLHWRMLSLRSLCLHDGTTVI